MNCELSSCFPYAANVTFCMLQSIFMNESKRHLYSAKTLYNYAGFSPPPPVCSIYLDDTTAAALHECVKSLMFSDEHGDKMS